MGPKPDGGPRRRQKDRDRDAGQGTQEEKRQGQRDRVSVKQHSFRVLSGRLSVCFVYLSRLPVLTVFVCLSLPTVLDAPRQNGEKKHFERTQAADVATAAATVTLLARCHELPAISHVFSTYGAPLHNHPSSATCTCAKNARPSRTVQRQGCAYHA